MPVLLNLEKVTLVCACACSMTFCEKNWKMKFKSHLILKMILAIKIRSLVTYVLTGSRANVSCILTCSRANVSTCLTCLHANVPCVLMCSRALHALRAYVLTCCACLSAHVL